MRNENLRFQRLLDNSRAQVERTTRQRDVAMRERDTTQGERDMAILAYNMRDKNLDAECFHIGIKIDVSKDYCEKNLLNSYCISEILTVFSKIPDSCRPMPKTR